MDVWISFKGSQNVDGETNFFEFNTRGTLDSSEDGYRISYDESNSIGIDGVFTTIHVNSENVLLERQGAINSVLVLEKGRRTTCNYDMGHGNLLMGVFATHINSSIKPQDGKIDPEKFNSIELNFKYNLDIESSFTSSHDINVIVNKNAGDIPNEMFSFEH